MCIETANQALSYGNGKKESNDGFEHAGMQKDATFTIVCTLLLIRLNNKSYEKFIKQYIYLSLLFHITKSRVSLNNTEIICGEHVKL